MAQFAEAFLPGDFIREELEERGWTQGDLASIMGRPVETINRILAGKLAITPETARGLSAAMGTSAELWMNLEAAYQLSRLKQGDNTVERRARLFDMAPIKAMTKRGWIEPSNSVDVLEQQVVDYFGLNSIDDEPCIAVAARKGTAHPEADAAQRAWFFRVKQIAETLDAAPYSKKRLQSKLDELRALATHPMESRRIAAVLAAAGVRFLVVEHLSRTKIDGTALWLDKNRPVIALSLRYDRIDGLWHTLAHELGHILHRDAFSLDVNLNGDTRETSHDKSEQERRADEFASTFLIPEGELDDFILRIRPMYSKKKIEGFARRVGVHPGIVVGQLQYRSEIKYSHNREMLARVRDVIVSTTTTDGWGNKVFPVAPLNPPGFRG